MFANIQKGIKANKKRDRNGVKYVDIHDHNVITGKSFNMGFDGHMIKHIGEKVKCKTCQKGFGIQWLICNIEYFFLY